jgi:hypothetical protein
MSKREREREGGKRERVGGTRKSVDSGNEEKTNLNNSLTHPPTHTRDELKEWASRNKG